MPETDQRASQNKNERDLKKMTFYFGVSQSLRQLIHAELRVELVPV